MSHWLDDVARGFSEGSFSRREVLRRGGAVAGGALLASVTGPVGTLTRASAATGPVVPCPDLNSPCSPPDVCCGGEKCIDLTEAHCCPHGTHDCFNDETCCGDGNCCAKDEFCCGDSFCLRRAGETGCCHGATYNVKISHCCPHGRHSCFNGEKCCGATECCKKHEQCCNSGRLAYCAPKGHCCPKGKHRVSCSGGKHLCCPEGEDCCGGVCCKPGNCQDGKCQACNPACQSGQQCCPGPWYGGTPNFCCEDNQTCCHYCGCQNPGFLCCPGDCIGGTTDPTGSHTGAGGQYVCCGQTGESGWCGYFSGATGAACCLGGKKGCVCTGTGTCCAGNCACYPDGTCQPTYGHTSC